MNKCLCCGKPLDNGSATGCWHSECIKRFFGVTKLPELEITEAILSSLALESTRKGLTVPGVQKKLSLQLTKERNPRLTLVNYPTGYIIKPQTDEYVALPEAEFLVMNMARLTGIKTVPFALIDAAGEKAYITKRIDRKIGHERMEMLAMEDFCQLEGRLTADKYKGSYERCAKVIERFSTRAGLDLTELFIRVVFSFVVGNSDMHLKNFSLIETAAGSASYVLSEAYDMLPVNIILPSDMDEMALTLNGKKRNLRRKDFLSFAEACGINKNSADKIIGKILSLEEQYVLMCRDSYLPPDMKDCFESLIIARCDTLLGQ